MLFRKQRYRSDRYCGKKRKRFCTRSNGAQQPQYAKLAAGIFLVMCVRSAAAAAADHADDVVVIDFGDVKIMFSAKA